MILATLYFIVFCIILRKASFFKDEQLSYKFILAILFLKILGCAIYYWIYFKYYPGSFKNDSTSTMQDAMVVYNALPNHISDYLKIIFGAHSDFSTDPLYNSYFKHIDKWGGSDSVSDYFLNDNRTSIRLHAVIMLFSFGHYAVHALVMLVLSFMGQFAFYKTYKIYFKGKEFLLAFIIFITPSILFWTSGVLKEPLAIFLIGIFIYSYFNIFIHKNAKTKTLILFAISIFGFLILKPYILVLLIVPLSIFTIVNKYQIKKITLFYFISFVLLYGTGIFTLKYVLKKDIIKTIVTRQNDFVNLSKGGVFLLNETKYVRLDPEDYDCFVNVNQKHLNIGRIKPHTKLMYWDAKHINNLRDTLFDNDNKDSSLFHFHSFCPVAGSGITINKLEPTFTSFMRLIPQSFYNVLCKPFFHDSNSITELMASLENLFFILFGLICFIYSSKTNPFKNQLLLFSFIIISSFLLIGLTTTVMGAIVRYKVPFLPFLLMIPLLYLDIEKLKKNSIIKRFIKSN